MFKRIITQVLLGVTRKYCKAAWTVIKDPHIQKPPILDIKELKMGNMVLTEPFELAIALNN